MDYQVNTALSYARDLLTFFEFLQEKNPICTDKDTSEIPENVMSVRSVEYMVKKFSSESVAGKKISPHKLRSTYGTALYNQTSDIRLVADVLGHKDVNTTIKHYAAIDEEHRRRAAEVRPYD